MPGGEQFVDAGVTLHGTGRSGRDPAGPVAVLAGTGEVLGDVGGPFREHLTHRVGDPNDAPVPQMPRRPIVQCDVEPQLDRPRGRVETPDHRRCFDRVAQRRTVQRLPATRLVEHLDHVGDQDVIMGGGVPGSRGRMTSHRVGQPTGRGTGLGPASPAAPFLEPAVQPVHRRRSFDVEDRVHRVRLALHAEHRDRLMRRNHQLEPRPARLDQPVTARWDTEPARTERRLVRRRRHLTEQTQNDRACTSPPQRCFTPRPVVGERGTRMIIGATEHRCLVIRDLIRAHRAEPGHLNSRRTSRHPSRESRNRRLHSCSSSRAVFALAWGVSK